jgi:hypothetical protein
MACTISGMAGTYQYAGGTATLVCTPYGTTTAVTAPSTAISTRSCAEDGFPATWTRTATGTCVAPIVSAPVATAPASGGSISPGMACSTGGYPGTYQYSGGATLICVATTIAPVATAPVATTPSTVAPATTSGTVAPSLVGTWAYNSGDGTATTSCNYNGTMRCGWYYTSTPGSYSLGPPR